jgi:fermentation-respiration switch protein FrsA (DUF1100 family)
MSMRALATLVLALSLAGCTSVFFQPSRALYATPGQYGLDYERVEFEAADGTSLFAWFLQARGEPRGTVLYLHGNAENISTHFANVAWMPAAGFNVLAFDYRGYGASAGRPTLAGVQLDIDAAMRVLLARPDVDPQRIVVFGQSLGGALAIYYVAHSPQRTHVRALIADSSFSDYRLIAQEKLASTPLTWLFQWLPRLAINNDYSPQAAIKALSPIPLLLIHGDADTLVPAEHSRHLYEIAAQPKELWILEGVGHIQSLRERATRERLAVFLRQQVQAPPRGSF